MAYDPKSQLSAHYTLANLTQTSKPVSTPNLPSSAEHFNNLKLLADALEYLDSKIGPFNIMSGYRTKELQNLLKSAGEPVATGTSFHELGLGVDIYPTTMKIAEYFGKILADPIITSRFVEIAIKPSQNTLHLSVRNPNETRATRITQLNPQGSYVGLSKAQIDSYAAPYRTTASTASGKGGIGPLAIGAAIAGGLALMLV